MSATELKFADLADQLPGAIVLADCAGRIVSTNRAARNLLAIAPDQVELADLIVESGVALERYLTTCARTFQPLPGRFKVASQGGEVFEMHVYGARVRQPDTAQPLICLSFQELVNAGQHQRFVTLSETIERLKKEIKARQRAEALLEAEKQVLASIVAREPLETALSILCLAVEKYSSGMRASILLLDKNGCLRHAAAPSLPPDYSAAIDGVEIGPEVGSCGTAAFTGKQVIVTDIAKDPLWTPYRELASQANLAACWSTPVRGSDNSILGTLALYYDTPREPSAEDLRLIDDSTHIASLAIERHVAQIKEKRLLLKTRRERERAKEENRAKDMFLAVLSHELRNPLSAISNAANVLYAQPEQDQAKQRLQQIVVNESQLLKRILDDLLDLSRLSRGKFRLQLAALDLDAFLDEFKAAQVAAYPEQTIEFSIDPELGWMQADRSRLRQSLQNLVDNAIKYSDADAVARVKVEADGDAINFAVEDAGEGISAQLLPKIFDPFVQSDGSLERTRSGLGLGLALVKRFCEMHGGSISVHSDGENCGSMFSMQLPRGKVTVPSEPEAESPAAGSGPKRILVVEDNADAREGLCQLLELWGHEVSFAVDGRQALESIRSNPPDIALVDIGLPELNGYQVAEAVRENPATRAVILIALTGYGQGSDRLRAKKAGFDSHLVKPADPADLIKILGSPQAVA